MVHSIGKLGRQLLISQATIRVACIDDLGELSLPSRLMVYTLRHHFHRLACIYDS